MLHRVWVVACYVWAGRWLWLHFGGCDLVSVAIDGHRQIDGEYGQCYHVGVQYYDCEQEGQKWQILDLVEVYLCGEMYQCEHQQKNDGYQIERAGNHQQMIDFI